MTEELEQRVSHIESSLYLCGKAFDEIWNITQTPNSKEEYALVTGPPFSFYSTTLQYCLIMEYSKLLEKKRPNNNPMASLQYFNELLKIFLGEQNFLKYQDNVDLLELLYNSNLYIRIKTLRDKKFGHADNHEINNPFKIEGFSGKEIEGISKQIDMLLEIANNCFNVLADRQFALHRDNRTANFIRYHTQYKEYYYKNYFTAYKEGFGLRSGVAQ